MNMLFLSQQCNNAMAKTFLLISESISASKKKSKPMDLGRTTTVSYPTKLLNLRSSITGLVKTYEEN